MPVRCSHLEIGHCFLDSHLFGVLVLTEVHKKCGLYKKISVFSTLARYDSGYTYMRQSTGALEKLSCFPT